MNFQNYNKIVILLIVVLSVASPIITFIGEMQVYLISYVKLSLTRYAAIALFVIILFIILYIIWQLINWYYMEYILTDSRIIIKSGVLYTKKNYMPYGTIQDVSTSQSIVAKILNVGTVSVYSAYDNNQMKLANISNVSEVENIIFSRISNQNNLRGRHSRNDFSVNRPQNEYYSDDGYYEPSNDYLSKRRQYLDEDYYDENEYYEPQEYYKKEPVRDYEYYPEELNFEEEKRHKENEAAYEKYLENLRAYKSTKHPIMFGWFNAWQPDGAGKYPRLSLLPDSMDVVSIWGNWHSLSEEKIKELRSVQAKGTKVIIGWIIEDIGDQIKWGRDQWPADDTQAIKEYAQAIVDTINKYGYDGFDYDYEPSYASPFKPGNHCGNLTSCSRDYNKEKEILFMKTMRELLGPDKLFHLNGSIHWLDPRAAQYFDRFVVQSYNGSASSFERWTNDIQNRLNIKPEQLVFTESFQNKPGARSRFPGTYAGYVASKQGNVGGIGVFHINEDAFEDEAYVNIRKAISIMNPPVK